MTDTLPDPSQNDKPNLPKLSIIDPATQADPNAPSFDPTLNLLATNLPNLANSTSPVTDELEWVPEDALDSFVTERTMNPNETNKETARRLINENIAILTTSMIHLALHSKSERTRLDAGKYLMDRSLGKAGENAPDQSPLENFFSEVSDFVNAHQDNQPKTEGSSE